MSLTREKAQLMSASEIDRTLVRLAHEILEKTKDLDKLAFIGIRRRGVPLAQRLSKKIENLENRKIPVGILDINLYRDDLSTVDIKPVVNATELGCWMVLSTIDTPTAAIAANNKAATKLFMSCPSGSTAIDRPNYSAGTARGVSAAGTVPLASSSWTQSE